MGARYLNGLKHAVRTWTSAGLSHECVSLFFHGCEVFCLKKSCLQCLKRSQKLPTIHVGTNFWTS